jgi:pyrroloquinoline quinone (PQQ) biosynthesis protein C
MALTLAKVPPGDAGWNGKARHWLIGNIHVERQHALWWRQWAEGFGVPESQIDDEVFPLAEVDAINCYLWRLCTHGSLAEAIAATNYAVEGTTGEWTRKIVSNLKKYEGMEGVHVGRRTLAWLKAHSVYDDMHPREALEILKAYATTPAEQKKVVRATVRANEYLAMALDACYGWT